VTLKLYINLLNRYDLVLGEPLRTMVEQDAGKSKEGADVPHEGFFAHEFGRVRKILRPDGKKLHIAQTPEEVEKLKRRLSRISPMDQDWEVVIHGSLEHVSLRHCMRFSMNTKSQTTNSSIADRDRSTRYETATRTKKS
jgi:hypothetical protein